MGVERRETPRYKAEAPVTVTFLDSEVSTTCSGHLEEVADNSLCILIPHPANCGALVKVELRDQLMLGEVVRVQPWQGQHRLALRIRHALQNLPEVAALAAAWKV